MRARTRHRPRDALESARFCHAELLAAHLSQPLAAVRKRRCDLSHVAASGIISFEHSNSDKFRMFRLILGKINRNVSSKSQYRPAKSENAITPFGRTSTKGPMTLAPPAESHAWLLATRAYVLRPGFFSGGRPDFLANVRFFGFINEKKRLERDRTTID